MPALLVQTKASSVTNTGSATVTPGSNVLRGSALILVLAANTNAGSVSSVTDSQGNTWTRMTGFGVTFSSTFTDGYYCLNAKPGATTVTVAFSAGVSATKDLFLHEVSGVAAFDKVATPATGTGTSATTNALTPTEENEYILAFCYPDTSWGGSFSNLAGQTYRSRIIQSGDGTMDCVHRGPIAATQPTFTITSGNWRTGLAAFKATPDGPQQGPVQIGDPTRGPDSPTPIFGDATPAATPPSSNVDAPPAIAAGVGLAPAVSGGATVDPAIATAAGVGVPPAVSGGATIAAPPATAAGSAPAPSIVTGQTLAPSPATAAGVGVAPAVSGGATIAAAVATAAGVGVAPAVSGGATVSAPPAVAAGVGVAPSVSGGATVAAAIATSAWVGVAPSVSVGGSATVSAPPAVAAGVGVAPSVSGGATVAAAIAVSVGSAPAPAVAAGATLAATVATAAAVGRAPAVSGGAIVGAPVAAAAGVVVVPVVVAGGGVVVLAAVAVARFVAVAPTSVGPPPTYVPPVDGTLQLTYPAGGLAVTSRGSVTAARPSGSLAATQRGSVERSTGDGSITLSR